MWAEINAKKTVPSMYSATAAIFKREQDTQDKKNRQQHSMWNQKKRVQNQSHPKTAPF